MVALAGTVTKLCNASIRDYINPYSYLEWPESVDIEQWSTSPELISLYGMRVYESLSPAEQKRLSFYEAVNFFSLNIHGEKSLIEGLAQRLYRKGNDMVSPYIHHFLDEENKHMVYFGGFCARYAGKVYPDRKMVFDREYAPGEEDVLFFAKVLVFEEIVDVHNKRMAKDNRLVPVIRQINFMHHRDESRHLAFGRLLVKDLFERYSPTWSRETLDGVREYMKNYITATWKEYYNPAVYKDAGLANPFDIQEEALQAEVTRAHRKEISARCIQYLIDTGILTELPQL
ncbi:MAG TPA: diiron oxygenase [Terriglobia bacterium]|nr:diiron oxygenase [Terriglobia bacterium]